MNNSEEYDVSNEAWKIYSKVYCENIEIMEGDFHTKRGRPFVKKTFKYNGKESKLLKFSGETDFNFSKKKVFGYGRSRYEHFKVLLANTSPEYERKLDECYNKFHSQENISILPQTGNLQFVKKGIGNDRLDTFIWCLNAFYQNQGNLMLNFCSADNITALNSYLHLFSNACEYCSVIYGINQELTLRLITSGKQEIDSPKRVIEYMNLANDFWEQKRNYIDSKFKQ